MALEICADNGGYLLSNYLQKKQGFVVDLHFVMADKLFDLTCYPIKVRNTFYTDSYRAKLDTDHKPRRPSPQHLYSTALAPISNFSIQAYSCGVFDALSFNCELNSKYYVVPKPMTLENCLLKD
jgi:hypothetical protein